MTLLERKRILILTVILVLLSRHVLLRPPKSWLWCPGFCEQTLNLTVQHESDSIKVRSKSHSSLTYHILPLYLGVVYACGCHKPVGACSITRAPRWFLDHAVIARSTRDISARAKVRSHQYGLAARVIWDCSDSDRSLRIRPQELII